MAALIEKEGYFTSLPRDYYVSSGIYAREIEKIVHRQWLMVGHISAVKQVGDYFVAQVGPESLIIVRDRNQRIRAYFNVCRHRGFQLCAKDARGNAKRFTCPYHAWTFDCDGSLKAVPGAQNGREFNFQDWGLHEAYCDTLYGFIYVWLGREQPPAIAAALPLFHPADDASIRALQPERMKVIHREIYIFHANWKVVMENENECYHCGVGHASLIRSCDYVSFYADTRSGAHFPLKPGMKTLSMDGEWVCKRLLGEPQAAGFSTGHLYGPLFGGPLFFADHAVIMQLTPLSPDQTQLWCDWMVHEDAVEGVDYDTQRVIELFHNTNLEDRHLSERTWAGVQSSRFTPGPNSATREDGLRLTLTRYLEMMGAP